METSLLENGVRSCTTQQVSSTALDKLWKTIPIGITLYASSLQAVFWVSILWKNPGNESKLWKVSLKTHPLSLHLKIHSRIRNIWRTLGWDLFNFTASPFFYPAAVCFHWLTTDLRLSSSAIVRQSENLSSLKSVFVRAILRENCCMHVTTDRK